MKHQYILNAAEIEGGDDFEGLHTIEQKVRGVRVREMEKLGLFNASEYWLVESRLDESSDWFAYGAIRARHLSMLLRTFCAIEDIRLTPVKVIHA